MRLRKKKSILFIRPDYHCSFFYRDEFVRQGWTADIYVDWCYPNKLLYSNCGILRAPNIEGNRSRLVGWVNHILLAIWWMSIFWRYEYHLYYGRPPAVNFLEEKLRLTQLFGKDFLVELWLARLLGIKLIFLPTGCHDDESKEIFSKFEGGNVCGNCGAWHKCFDELNNANFARIRRFFAMQIGVGAIDSSQFRMSHIKYKAIDLELWSPQLEISPEHALPPSKNIRILHSAYLEKSGRNWKGRNIKGSPFILDAIEKLKSEGYPIEYYNIIDKSSNQIRFYQAQADIVVEQLIYGWWGSTFVETAALGKPVVCYLRPSWKEFFFQTFPEYTELPIIEANTDNIYDVLKALVTDEAYRRKKGEESRRFAEAHFDPVKNTRDFIKILGAL